ncbi:MAG: TIGR00730 family Rossman fold protein [Burkholderiaceae bacterium]
MTIELTARTPIKSVCVYCGASNGVAAVYMEAAQALAAALVETNIALVYGGGNVGLMGAIADEVIRLGGDVTGVIPEALMDKEVGHHAVTRLFVVRDMHERKARMAELSDGFIALPGGIGTLEELFEMLTWSQLGYHDKPIGLLNVAGFYDRLIDLTEHLVVEGFLKRQHAELLMQESAPLILLKRFAAFRPDRSVKILHQQVARSLLK